MSSLILVEGIDLDFLHKCALEDCTEQHQFSSAPDIVKVCPDFFYGNLDLPESEYLIKQCRCRLS